MVKIRNIYGDEWHGKQGSASYETDRKKGWTRRRIIKEKNANTEKQKESRQAFIHAKEDYKTWIKLYKKQLRACIHNNNERDRNGYPLTLQQYITKIYTDKIKIEKKKRTVPESWHNTDFNKRTWALITNRTDREIRDYAVLIVIPSAHDILSAEYPQALEIRDAETGQRLNYYIERMGTSTETMLLWVNIMLLKPSEQKKIWIYYDTDDYLQYSKSNPHAVFWQFIDLETCTTEGLITNNDDTDIIIHADEEAALRGRCGLHIIDKTTDKAVSTNIKKTEKRRKRLTRIALMKNKTDEYSGSVLLRAYTDKKGTAYIRRLGNGYTGITTKEGGTYKYTGNETTLRLYIATDEDTNKVYGRIETDEAIEILEKEGAIINLSWQPSTYATITTWTNEKAEGYIDNIAITGYAERTPDTEIKGEYETLKGEYTEITVKQSFIMEYELIDDEKEEYKSYYYEFLDGKIPKQIVIHAKGRFKLKVRTPHYSALITNERTEIH